jgi:hypothetical protein
MTDTREMLDASPTDVPLGAAKVASAIDARLNCAQACISDADADLVEQSVSELRTCISLCMNCADVCDVTAGLFRARRSGTTSSSTACSRPASARARFALRSAPGTLTIIVTAQSATRRVARAYRHAAPSSVLKLSTSSRSGGSRGCYGRTAMTGGAPSPPAATIKRHPARSTNRRGIARRLLLRPELRRG